MHRYTEAYRFQGFLPSGVFGRCLLHKQHLHFFFPHCLQVALKISFLHYIAHLRLSLKWSHVSMKKALELLYHGDQHYTTSYHSILLRGHQSDTVLSISATSTHSSVLFPANRYAPCQCFTQEKAEQQSRREWRRNPPFLKQGSDYTVLPLLTVIACYLTTLSFN